MGFPSLVSRRTRDHASTPSSPTVTSAPSRPPSPLKIPSMSRKLSWSPIRSPLGSPARSPMRSKSTMSITSNMSESSGQDEVVADWGDAPLPAFLRQSKSAISERFVDLEWQQRNRLAAGQHPSEPPSQWVRTLGCGDPHVRNRYLNVEVFAGNRVKLQVEQGGNDYINASPITLGKRRYISTQGPRDTTVAHFYRMLATETSSSAVVVMLTQTHEGGREKCFPYFPSDTKVPLVLAPDPDDAEPSVFEGTVTLVSSTENADAHCTVRHLKLRTRVRRKESPRTSPDPAAGPATKSPKTSASELHAYVEKDVWHLLFGAWPDFLLPEGNDRRALLELIALSRRLNKDAPAPDPAWTSFAPIGTLGGDAREEAELNPRVVHCSAGVGRSGTFIALDHLLTLLDQGELDVVASDRDPVMETVDRLRLQRMMMVQGESQFGFLYDALREKWLERWGERQRQG